jgi:hypothetical protein
MKTKLLTFGGLIIGLFVFYFSNLFEIKEYFYAGEKLKGLSFVAPSQRIGDTCFIETQKVNAKWVSLMPYSFLPEKSTELHFVQMSDSGKKQRIWWGETPWGIKECIVMARKQNLKIMLKPHMWLGWGEFTGNLNFKSDKEWKSFEESYKKYILTYAKIAQESKVEIFCIGTELENFVDDRPKFWQDLIKEIRDIYKGELTYAENWDCFEDVPFWSDLDFIGVDAYFPLSDKADPDLSEIKNGWKKHKNILRKISGKNQKPILFTEIGYKSANFATQEPWSTDFSKPENLNLQDRAYHALFEEVWKEPYFAGMFVWKWFPVQRHNSKRDKDTFSPQGKPAQKTIAYFFKE